MNSAVSGKATFGFNLTCNENDFLVGSYTYHDKAAGIDIAGAVTNDDEIDCTSGTAGGTSEWGLPYDAQHCTSDCSGIADVTVTDTNANGKIKGDTLSIELDFGVDAGYSNSGTIQGGNLVVTGT